MDPTELLIGGEAQYFFDDAVIETLVNLKRTIHRPERHPGNPIIQSDRPWEQITYTACNGAQFWRDPGTEPPHPIIVSNKLRNVPVDEDGIWAVGPIWVQALLQDQWYFE